MLQQMHVPPAVVTEAVGDAEKQNYQVACSKVYKGLHGKELVDKVVTHPNQYFQESRKQHEEMKGGQNTEKEDQEQTVESFIFKVLPW
jgi:DNA primase large subunit